MSQLKISIKGMHCRSCEILVEDELKEIPGVEGVSVSSSKGTADVKYSGQRPSEDMLRRAVQNAGYDIGKEDTKHFFSRNPRDWQELGIVAGGLFILYVILSTTGLLEFAPSVSSKPTVPVAFLIGLTAGISTCMALVGGLVLGIAARHAEKHPEATAAEKFKPHLFFNVGRLASYVVLGGLIGLLGAAFAPSGRLLGGLVIVAGAVMLFLGLKLMQVFPKLENAGLSMPKSVSRFFGAGKETKEYSNWGSFMTGALTFFLPCGFTQAMQVYAISTGSFAEGALIMGAFALGTAPGLLGLGGVSSVARGYWSRFFFKAVGVVVLVLGFVNMQAGWNLTGYTMPSFVKAFNESTTNGDPKTVPVVDGKQVVKMTQRTNGYYPNKFTIKKGVPVKWIVKSESQYTCAAYILAPKLGIQKFLDAGENVIEFTPKESGQITWSCSMGMYRGVFTVVD